MSFFYFFFFFFFKQKTAYEIGLGIPAEPLFRSFVCRALSSIMVICKIGRAVQQGKSVGSAGMPRSEERRVGKECRSGWGPYHEKKKRTSEGGRIRIRVAGCAISRRVDEMGVRAG